VIRNRPLDQIDSGTYPHKMLEAGMNNAARRVRREAGRRWQRSPILRNMWSCSERDAGMWYHSTANLSHWFCVI